MNHHLKLLQSLYSTAHGKYLKFKNRFDKAVHSGRFFKFNKKKQSSVVSRLKRLYERLKSLQTQLRLAGAGATLAITLTVSNPLQAQTGIGPFVRNDNANPFPEPFIFSQPIPAAVDIDNDGDLDLFVGELNGEIRFLVNNNGTVANQVKRFSESISGNPFSGVDVGYNAAPAFIDVDGDGDYDALIGNSDGYTRFFRNTGSATNPIFVEQTGPSNPFDGIVGTSNKYGGYGPAVPTFVDIDGDGDVDLFIGSSYTYTYYYSANPSTKFYENNGGVFTETIHPLINVIQNNYNVRLAFADVDGDGDMDAFVGRNGAVDFLKNEGSTFVLQSGPWNATNSTGDPFFGLSSFSGYAAPLLADFDNDSDLDFLVGNNFYGYSYSYQRVNSNLRYFENTDGDFTLGFRTNLNISPTGGLDVGSVASPAFVDIDGDGDLDAVIGNKYTDDNHLMVFLQDANGEFTRNLQHPLNTILNPLPSFFPNQINPVFVDIDNDGDQDLFITNDYQVLFLRNNAGVFTVDTNPLDGLTGSTPSLAFVDVDNDMDFDVIVGSAYLGTFRYFENQGTPLAPNFVEGTPPSPFNTINLGSFPYSNLLAVDLDNDGDIDIVLSETYDGGSGYDYTHVRFFANNGDGTFTENAMPIIAAASPRGGNTTFFDADGDGDLDAFMGNGGNSPTGSEDGRITYFENTNPPPVLVFSQPSRSYTFGSGAVTLDASLTLADPDGDNIASATITIQNFQAGDILSFTPQGGVVGSFDTNTGVLTLSGLAPVSTYQNIFRSVTYNFTGTKPVSGGRKGGSKAGRTTVVTKDIIFQAFDTDFTTPPLAALSVSVTFPNDAPVLATANPAVEYTGTPVAIDGSLTVGDADDAVLESALVSISPSTLVAGDELVFSNQNGISGSYNAASGVLTLTGTSSIANYQAALRSVQYRSTVLLPPASSRSVELFVSDGEDDSNVVSNAITLNVTAVNQPPVISPVPLTVTANQTLTLDLTTIISDPDNNLDPGSFAIVQAPASSALASIAGTILTINYAGTNFTGSDNLIIGASDLLGASTQATINISVVNQAPVITPSQLNTVVNGQVSLNLLSIVSDPDGNLDPTTFIITQEPVSGAMATINLSTSTLSVDYSNVSFAGADNLTIEVRDEIGVPASAQISILVAGEIIVRNGISPNGDGRNDFFQLDNIVALGAENKVTIFNRWGDKVFEIDNYDNDTRRFEGVSDDGKDLGSGVYFYKIEFSNGRESLEGYLTLKR